VELVILLQLLLALPVLVLLNIPAQHAQVSLIPAFQHPVNTAFVIKTKQLTHAPVIRDTQASHVRILLIFVNRIRVREALASLSSTIGIAYVQ